MPCRTGSTTLAALVRFLRVPLGKHIAGVFVDFACMYQPPMTHEQTAAIESATEAIALSYASPTGAMVARYADTPPCPANLAAFLMVAGPLEDAEACTAIRAELEEVGQTVVQLVFESSKSVWRVELGSADEVEEVANDCDGLLEVQGREAQAFKWYNEDPYAKRACAEAGANAGEMLLRFENKPRLALALARLPAKLVDIGGAAPAVASYADEAARRKRRQQRAHKIENSDAMEMELQNRRSVSNLKRSGDGHIVLEGNAQQPKIRMSDESKAAYDKDVSNRKSNLRFAVESNSGHRIELPNWRASAGGHEVMAEKEGDYNRACAMVEKNIRAAEARSLTEVCLTTSEPQDWSCHGCAVCTHRPAAGVAREPRG